MPRKRQVAQCLFCFCICLVMACSAVPGNLVSAQVAALPGVRGNLYESPSFGWILVVPPGEWTFQSSTTDIGGDVVSVVHNSETGPFQFFISKMDDGRGSSGCVDDMADLLTSSNPGLELTGWDSPEASIEELAPNQHLARAALRDPANSANDILVMADCVRSDDGLLIATATLTQASAQGDPNAAAPLAAIWPGDDHTGRPRRQGEVPAPGNGVVRFLARFDSMTNPAPLPFSCMDQESFTMPGDLPPAGMGYLACDGQIANVDTVPATIDLANIRLGCDSLPADEPLSPGCPDVPIPPTHGELIRVPIDASGSILTLQPGESAEVVLWYTLPEGDIPFDLLFLEPDRRIVAGETFFTAGSGSRPKVRAMR